MTVGDILARSDVFVGLRAANKTVLLEDLARRAAEALGLGVAEILPALHKREALGSTGVGDGVALPHARLDAVRRPFGLLATLRTPIAFEAIDDRPVDLVVLVLLPANARGAQFDALACVARRLRDPAAAVAMRAARHAADLHAAACGPGRADQIGA